MKVTEKKGMRERERESDRERDRERERERERKRERAREPERERSVVTHISTDPCCHGHIQRCKCRS